MPFRAIRAPERSRKTTWKEFLTQHWELIVAADFFTVEVWTRKGLQRFIILFFLDLSTRQVEIAGIASTANGLWMSQIGRRVTDAVDGILLSKRYLIHDRDPLFTAGFLRLLADVGVESVKLPPRSPNLNAYAERFVRSIKESCLERLILFGEESLRVALDQFVAHYHTERHHQGLGNRLIRPEPRHVGNRGVVQVELLLPGSCLNKAFFVFRAIRDTSKTRRTIIRRSCRQSWGPGWHLPLVLEHRDRVGISRLRTAPCHTLQFVEALRHATARYDSIIQAACFAS